LRKSLDNVTVVIITFESFERIFMGKDISSINSTMLSDARSMKNESKSKSRLGSIKKPALAKTFYPRSSGKEGTKHRRVDSGGKRLTDQVIEQIERRKRTNSDNKDSRNKLPEEGEKMSIGSSKMKQSSYSKFSHHFNYADSSKPKLHSKLTQPVYKRMAPPTKSMTTKHEESKGKSFKFDL
jgi:hypothetical protein